MAHGSQGLPKIPDGQISRVRFQTLACHRRPSQSLERFKRWFVYTPATPGLPTASPPKAVICVSPVLSSRPPRRPRKPPSVQSPFAQLGGYLRWGDVLRLLGESYFSFIARTGSCAAPVGLSPPSAFGLVQRVLAGCNQSLLPTAASRRYLRQSVLGCWIPYPGGTPCARACFFHGVIGLPQRNMGRLPAVIPLETTSCGGDFRGCRYFVMFRPPSLLAPQIVPTAANTPAGQPGLLRPSRTRFVASPRIGYANRLKTGNWRCGDLHPARLRPCRLLRSPRPYLILSYPHALILGYLFLGHGKVV